MSTPESYTDSMMFEKPQALAKSPLVLSLMALLIMPNQPTAAQSGVAIEFSDAGLRSLRYNNVEYLAFGDFRVEQAHFRSLNGSNIAGDPTGTIIVDKASRRIRQTFPWGTLLIKYAAAANRLVVTVTVSNRTESILDGLWFEPFGLRFVSKVREYDGIVPLISNTNGQPGVVQASDDLSVVVLASENGANPIQFGFPWALDRPKNTIFPLSFNTGRVASLPDSYPTIKRPIPPGGADSFSFSLRFGPPGSTIASLAGDVYKKFANDHPPILQWADRRAIGALFLSTAVAGWPNNPRGWMQDPKIDITTSAGLAEFRRRVLAYADGSIAILKRMNAQGMITWDVEGQQFAHPTSYIGDPRLVDRIAPEMGAIADEYFQRFRDAGMRVGVCIRPQKLIISADNVTARQVPISDPTEVLIEKVAYAKRRWGATLFYVDSNVNVDDPNPIEAQVFQKLANEFPDVLLIPEHSRTLYYGYAAPYRELRQGHASTDAEVRAIYPSAFSVIYTADGPIDQRHEDLREGVQHGDVLLFRAWFDDPQNGKDKMIYEEAAQASSIGKP
jgi:hypothetical protein